MDCCIRTSWIASWQLTLQIIKQLLQPTRFRLHPLQLLEQQGLRQVIKSLTFYNSKHSTFPSHIRMPDFQLYVIFSNSFTLRIAIALRLGAPVCAPHECICGELTDELGAHGLSCRKSAGRHFRHSAVNDLIKLRWLLLKFRPDWNRPQPFAITLVTAQIIKGQMDWPSFHGLLDAVYVCM